MGCDSKLREVGFERQTFVLPIFPVTDDGAPLEGSNVKPQYKLSVVATKPRSGDPPFPTVAFINGFQCKAPWYYHFADTLAACGMLVLQYTTPSFTIIPDSKELRFMDQLLTWADISNCQPDHFLHRCVDFNALGITGHSRGAKLAALHYARNKRFRAALLLDPVNNTAFTPESVEYPNACKALKECGRPVGIVGAGVIAGGNPEGSNWRNFYDSAAPGSWLAVLPTAGHMSFAKPGWFWSNLLNSVAGGAGKLSPDQVLDSTAPLMVTWFTKFLSTREPTPAQSSLLESTTENQLKTHERPAAAIGGPLAAGPALESSQTTTTVPSAASYDGVEGGAGVEGGPIDALNTEFAWPFHIPQNRQLSEAQEQRIRGLQEKGAINLQWR